MDRERKHGGQPMEAGGPRQSTLRGGEAMARDEDRRKRHKHQDEGAERSFSTFFGGPIGEPGDASPLPEGRKTATGAQQLSGRKRGPRTRAGPLQAGAAWPSHAPGQALPLARCGPDGKLNRRPHCQHLHFNAVPLSPKIGREQEQPPGTAGAPHRSHRAMCA